LSVCPLQALSNAYWQFQTTTFVLERLAKKNTTTYLGSKYTKSFVTLNHKQNALERLSKEKHYNLFRPYKYKKKFCNIDAQGKYAGKACQL
jgi:hypothetical protein